MVFRLLNPIKISFFCKARFSTFGLKKVYFRTGMFSCLRPLNFFIEFNFLEPFKIRNPKIVNKFSQNSFARSVSWIVGPLAPSLCTGRFAHTKSTSWAWVRLRPPNTKWRDLNKSGQGQWTTSSALPTEFTGWKIATFRFLKYFFCRFSDTVSLDLEPKSRLIFEKEGIHWMKIAREWAQDRDRHKDKEQSMPWLNMKRRTVDKRRKR